MSKLLFGALILAMAAMLACAGEDPTQPPATTPAPTMKPTQQPTATPAPTATPRPTATPTPAPAATPTPQPTVAAPAQVANGESIVPLPLDDLQALMSELSQIELICIAESGNFQESLTVLQALELSSPEAVEELLLCLRDRTVLRVFLSEIIGQTGPLTGETSACVRASYTGHDLRAIMLAGVTEEGEGGWNMALHLAISCLNEEEWASVAPALGLNLNYREGKQCLEQELGGPQEVADALRRSEQGPSFALVSAAIKCGLSESDLAALAMASSATTPRMEDSMSVITPLSIEDPVALMSELHSTEQSCISANVDPQQLAQLMGAPELSSAAGVALIQCFEDETLLRLFVSRLTGLTGPLGAESSACIRGGLGDLDLRSVMSAGDEGTATVDSMSASLVALSCLNDEEWQAGSAVTGREPSERENLQCAMERLGGPEGIAEARQSEDNGLVQILSASLECGLQLETITASDG